jgi:WhiB family transcriptional regulator, redox-sensing transcriptional regulator
MSETSQGLLQRPRNAAGTDWRNYAACRDVDPDLFFPLGTSGASLLQIDDAKQICRTCPVCGPCLRWALESGDAGVWGGTTEDERRKHRQRAMRVKRRSEIQADFLISLRTYSLFSLFPAPAR